MITRHETPRVPAVASLVSWAANTAKRLGAALRRRGVKERVLADIVLVNLGLVTGYLARALAMLWLHDPASPLSASDLSEVLERSIASYIRIAPAVTLLAILVFGAWGFYTHGRAYRGRYKALIILQAVSLTYLLVGAVGYLFLGVTAWFPRSVWIGGFLATLCYVLAARLGSKILRSMAFSEAQRFGKPPRRSIRNVLVIGGAGYVGSIVSRKLLARGYGVTVLDALLYGDDGIQELAGGPYFRLIEGDLRNIESVVRALEHQDAVVHLGGLVGDPACAMDEQLTLEINQASTRMIAEAARGFGVERFVFASSCSVYGASDELLTERSLLNPVSLYARTKIASEKILAELSGPSFVPTSLRFATLYGLSPRPRFDLVVNTLTANAVLDGRIYITGGDQWRPFVHVSDAAEVVVQTVAAPAGLVGGDTFNVGSAEENYQLRDLGSMLQGLLPDLHVDEFLADGDRRNYRVDFTKLSQTFGFQASYRVLDGMRELKSALERGAIEAPREDRYNNLKGLTSAANTLSSGLMNPLYEARPGSTIEP